MPLLTSYFTGACSNVEPPDDDVENASDAHTEVREVLEADPTLPKWGIDTVLIGSYSRQVSIRRVKDVDVLCKLPDVDTSKSSRAVLGEIVRVLRAVYGDRVDEQDRSVKVDFPDFGLLVRDVSSEANRRFAGL